MPDAYLIDGMANGTAKGTANGKVTLEAFSGSIAALDARKWKCFSGIQVDMLISLTNLPRTNFTPETYFLLAVSFAVPFAVPPVRLADPSVYKTHFGVLFQNENRGPVT